MRFLRIGLAATLVAMGTAATGQPIELEPEQALSLQIDEAGASEPVIVGIARSEWTAFDVANARHLAGQPLPEEALPFAEPLPRGPGVPPAPPIAPGVVRVRMMAVADQHTLLVIENGYDRALAYRAHMTLGGKSRPTDVCIVMPRRFSYEYWPDRIERLDLSDFRFVPWQDGQPVTCE